MDNREESGSRYPIYILFTSCCMTELVIAITEMLAVSEDDLSALNAVNLGICISIRIKAGSSSRQIFTASMPPYSESGRKSLTLRAVARCSLFISL